MDDEEQAAKQLVLDFQSKLDRASLNEVRELIGETHSADHSYRGMRPFYDLEGRKALAESVWCPLKQAMPCLQRRTDIFFASRQDLNRTGSVWVVSMGNFLGDFVEPWLGIPPSRKTVYLPFATLNRVEKYRIVETVCFLDIFAIVTQAGFNPYAARQTGGLIMSPGPKTHDGIVGGGEPADKSIKTYDLTVEMLTDLALSYTSPENHMRKFWHTDMNWFGPTGIGASLGFPGYRRGHTGPFEDKLEVLEIHDWEVAVAEGNFSAVMWWPCLTMKNIGGYMGVPANNAQAEMRVVDLYRREESRLAENWIFIDLLHFLAEQGVDILAEIGENDDAL